MIFLPTRNASTDMGQRFLTSVKNNQKARREGVQGRPGEITQHCLQSY